MSRKSLLLIFALFMGMGSLFAQEQKQLALVEEFTNTSCGPCAGFAPYLDAALRKNPKTSILAVSTTASTAYPAGTSTEQSATLIGTKASL